MSRVADLGIDGVGCGAVAPLSERGHDVVLWSPSGYDTAAFPAARRFRQSAS